ncbi:unnamed protein product, partial [Dicrocoelium dendriticum]
MTLQTVTTECQRSLNLKHDAGGGGGVGGGGGGGLWGGGGEGGGGGEWGGGGGGGGGLWLGGKLKKKHRETHKTIVPCATSLVSPSRQSFPAITPLLWSQPPLNTRANMVHGTAFTPPWLTPSLRHWLMENYRRDVHYISVKITQNEFPARTPVRDLPRPTTLPQLSPALPVMNALKTHTQIEPKQHPQNQGLPAKRETETRIPKTVPGGGGEPNRTSPLLPWFKRPTQLTTVARR